MTVLSTDIKLYLSGGDSNTDIANSIGGIISSFEIVSNNLHNLFPEITDEDLITGTTEYRCFYVKNTSPISALLNTKIWIKTNTVTPNSYVYAAIGLADNDETEAIAIGEPPGIIFTNASSIAALTIGDLPINSYKSVWLKRVVSTTANIKVNDSVTISITGKSDVYT